MASKNEEFNYSTKKGSTNPLVEHLQNIAYAAANVTHLNRPGIHEGKSTT